MLNRCENELKTVKQQQSTQESSIHR